MSWSCYKFTIFFFQAEDGIRVGRVTGVQTCALPIYRVRHDSPDGHPRPSRAAPHARHRGSPPGHRYDIRSADMSATKTAYKILVGGEFVDRSEERRVGKECRARKAPAREHVHLSRCH